ncbi:MAG: hypothetical protein WAM95_04985 [Bacillus sp. (in: firmicutes)]
MLIKVVNQLIKIIMKEMRFLIQLTGAILQQELRSFFMLRAIILNKHIMKLMYIFMVNY